MKTFILAAGLAFAVAASTQGAVAGERHPTKSERTVVRQPSRAASDAYAQWPAPEAAPSGYGSVYYSGGYSAPAGR